MALVWNSILILPFLFWLLLTVYINAEPHRHRRLMYDLSESNQSQRMSSPPAINQGIGNLIIGPIVLIVSLILISIRFCLRNPHNELLVVRRENEVEGAKQFDVETMKVATSNFAMVNWLGEGRFGAVYRGKLQNGQEVAIKRLIPDSRREITEFVNQVQLVAKLQHANLVRLVGFCVEGEERMLVYEFVPNSSLDKYLFDQSESIYLTWEQRHKIILGIASGLQYLHENLQLAMGQCDLKASNILLEQDLNPKISNVGVERLVAMDHSQGNTTNIGGTLGYIARDVYSFGVIVLEIVSGQQNEGLAFRARKHWNEGTIDELVDPTLQLQMNVSRKEVMRCIQIALLCVQQDAATRPTMQAALFMLNNSSAELPSPF